MKTKLRWISSEKWIFSTTFGKTVVVIIKVRQLVQTTCQEFPQGYKLNWIELNWIELNWIAYNQENPVERIILDNHHGKSLHWHDDEKEESFPEWVSLGETKKLFWKRIISKFGLLIN